MPNAAELTDHAARAIEAGDLAAADRLLGLVLAQGRPPVAALVNAGLLRARQGRPGDAAALFREAVRRDKDNAKARFNLALTLSELGRQDEAAAAATLLVNRRPTDRDALALLADIRRRQGKHRTALDLLARAAREGADIAPALSTLALGFAESCDWSVRAGMRAALTAALEPGRVDGGLIDCFTILSHEDDPRAQAQAAVIVANAVRARVGRPAPLPRPLPASGRRVHLAYLSADFHRHATAELLAGVLERHDRARFVVSAYSFGIEQATGMRSRMVAAPDRFVELGMEAPAATVARMRADGVDVLIDLKGYTEGARPEIAALRAAPVQVSYLGFPATLGADWMDYAIADATVIPADGEFDWAERIVRLAASYQPNDDRRPTPAPDTDRPAHGLPADGIVFACFNNSFKITPERFAIWLRILDAVPDSVLWLLDTDAAVATNLRRAATAAGTDAARLVFSPYVSTEAHLARHGCADVFLDTGPYGAHTTASNALWMGLPVVTLPGRCFASRVGASLLRACGLDALIAVDEDAFVALAVALAGDAARRDAIARHLVEGRATLALFDTAATTLALETAFVAMVDRAAIGAAPVGFAVGEVKLSR